MKQTLMLYFDNVQQEKNDRKFMTKTFSHFWLDRITGGN